MKIVEKFFVIDEKDIFLLKILVFYLIGEEGKIEYVIRNILICNLCFRK